MIFKNSQQDVLIEEPQEVKVVGLKISGGADSAIVGYMLGKYVAEERPDIKIIPMTTIHPTKPFQEIYSKKVLEFLCKEFGEIFGKHYVNMATNGPDYITAQNRLLNSAWEKERIDSNYSGITANPPREVMETFRDIGPDDDRNGKTFPITTRFSHRHLVNIDKKGVAELYQTLGLVNSLFPLTRSCEAHVTWPIYNINKHCTECWWCEERYWGFGKYE